MTQLKNVNQMLVDWKKEVNEDEEKEEKLNPKEIKIQEIPVDTGDENAAEEEEIMAENHPDWDNEIKDISRN